ncbi:MAG: nuclear transport factor 2 family protein, partial [Ancalomicrobiaceae bacterium]|nr:nuclear transport factor 2 family protein [Ancalomicrobiaceae bacterium]
MLDKTPTAEVETFLGRFEEALASGRIDAAVEMFAAECYWRDLVTFTWNIKTVEGRGEVRDMLAHCLATTKPR